MDKTINENQLVFKQMKECFEELGLEIMRGDEYENLSHFASFISLSDLRTRIFIVYYHAIEVVELFMRDISEAPASKVQALYELTGLINADLSLSHFFVSAKGNFVGLRSGMVLPGKVLNKEAFKALINRTIATACDYKWLIEKQLHHNVSPESIINQKRTRRDLFSDKGEYVGDSTGDRDREEERPET